MKIYTLDCELIVPRPIEDTFTFFEDPGNLARITPAWMGFEILTPNPRMRAGLAIDYRFRWLGMPLTWRTLISEYEPPWMFVDEALKSPYTLWRHRHEFESCGESTIVRDHVDYALPLGPLGQMAHRLVVRRQLEGIFRYRQSRIAAFLGAMQEPA